jgi:hypothetical protein
VRVAIFEGGIALSPHPSDRPWLGGVGAKLDQPDQQQHGAGSVETGAPCSMGFVTREAKRT